MAMKSLNSKQLTPLDVLSTIMNHKQESNNDAR